MLSPDSSPSAAGLQRGDRPPFSLRRHLANQQRRSCSRSSEKCSRLFKGPDIGVLRATEHSMNLTVGVYACMRVCVCM